jgi:hypothetical protein
LAIWNNWLLSKNPDIYDGSQILFLRGNLDYTPPVESINYPRRINYSATYERTGRKAIIIFEETAIFVPIITACYTIGTQVDGKLLRTEHEARLQASKDIELGSNMWLTIWKKGQKNPSKIVPKLTNFLTESPLFKLVIPKNSLLNRKQYLPADKAGIFEAVSCAYCMIIKSLHPSNYVINFGGIGRGDYYTNSVYELQVQQKSYGTVRDISSRKARRL